MRLSDFHQIPEDSPAVRLLVLRQTVEFARTLLHLKAWHFLLGLVAAIPLSSGAFLSIILGTCDLNSEPDLNFYRSTDLQSALQLVKDKGNGNASWTGLALTTSMNWPSGEVCGSAMLCSKEIFRHASTNLADRVKQAKPSPIFLECFEQPYLGKGIDCTMLYELTELYESKDLPIENMASLGNLKLIHFSRDQAQESSNYTKMENFNKISIKIRQSLPTSQPTKHPAGKCSIFNKLFATVVTISFSISSMTVIIYFTVCTLSCIAKLKQGGFLQLQYRSGLHAFAYWFPLWTVTTVECLLMSGIFVAGHSIYCQEFSKLKGNMPRVFVAFFFYCLTVAALAILAGTLQASLNASCMLMMLLNIAIISGYAYAPDFIRNENTIVLHLMPPLSTLQYITKRISSDGFGASMSPIEADHYKKILPCIFTTPTVIIVLAVYLDFIVPEGNGLCLPWYFPFTRKFWFPRTSGSSQYNRQASQKPFVSVDSVTVIYGKWCGFNCGKKKALKRASCEIYPGRITWLAGARGSGKSTLLKLLGASSLTPVSGSITIDGCQMTGLLDRLGMRHKIGCLSQTDCLNDSTAVPSCLTIERCLALTQASRGSIGNSTHDLLGGLGFSGLEGLTPASLTSGERRLFSLILALIGSPDLLLLEEPTWGLEAAAEQRVWRLLRDLCARGSTAVVVTTAGRAHGEPTPMPCPEDAVVLLSDGYVVGSGTPKYDHRHSIAISPLISLNRVVEELQLRLPSGTVLLPGRPGTTPLKLITGAERLAECVAILEAAAGEELIAADFRLLPPVLNGTAIEQKETPSMHTYSDESSEKLAQNNNNNDGDEQIDSTDSHSIETHSFSCDDNIGDRSINNNSGTSGSDVESECGSAKTDKKENPRDSENKSRRSSSDSFVSFESCKDSEGSIGTVSINNSDSKNGSNNSSSHNDNDITNENEAPMLHRRRLSEVRAISTVGDDTKLKPSRFHRFRAIWLISAKRLVRKRSLLLARMIMPSLALGCLALLAALDGKRHQKLGTTSSSSLAEKGEVAAAKKVFTTCVCNNDTDREETALQYTDCSQHPVLYKSEGTDLITYLAQRQVIENLQISCWTSGKLCTVLDPGTWNKTVQNIKRNVTIGLLETVSSSRSSLSHNALVFAYREAVDKIVRYFGAKQAIKEPLMAYDTSQSYCMHGEMVVILFATIFSLYPATFLNDPCEDMETKVYEYLKTLWVGAATYWIGLFLIHWFQYSLYFVLSVGILQIWDHFRNPYYIFCICLPVLFMGTASNQLSVYTTAAMNRARNGFVSFSYYCMVLIVPCTLHGVAKMSKIPVIAMIWIVPQAAPVALILFGMRLGGQRTVLCVNGDTPEGSELLHQMWDLQSTLWSNVFVLNAIVAMPIQVILQGALLAALESDLHAVSDKFRCILFRRHKRRDSRWGAAAQLTSSHSTSGENLPMTSGACETQLYRGQNILEIKDLWKTCPSNGLPVLRDATFELAAGETLILLGSGKSATAAIAGGEAKQISGDCRVLCRSRLCQQTEQGLHHDTCGAIGYCPSYCPLFDWLTVSEHLHFYARVRGVPKGSVNERVHYLLDSLGLRHRRHWKVDNLDREVRRRICLSIALLSCPQLLVLDSDDKADEDAGNGVWNEGGPIGEAEEGRRLVRLTLRRLKVDCGASILATFSGADDETAAAEVDDRMAGAAGVGPARYGILHRGRIAALGTARHLRTRLGDWLVLDAYLDAAPESVQAAKKETITLAIFSRFRGSILLEERGRWMQFCLRGESCGRLSDAIRWLSGRESSISLEQFFLYHMSVDRIASLSQLSPLRSGAPVEEDIAS